MSKHQHKEWQMLDSANRHLDNANSILVDGVTTRGGWEAVDARLLAGYVEAAAEATLALAHEQRTANLIALYSDGCNGQVAGIDYRGLITSIKLRLGLTTGLGD